MRYLANKAYHSVKRNISSLTISLIAFAVFLFLFQSLIDAESEKISSKRTIETADHLNYLKTQVDRELNTLLFVSNGLSSYINVYHDELNDKKLLALLQDLFKKSKHIRNIGVARGYRIEYIYPIQSNEKALGIDYRDLPNQWPQVKKAIDTHQGVLAGPVDLIQGGSGLIYRYPVYVNNQYWGILATVIDTYSFLNAAFSDTKKNDYDFAIRVKMPASEVQHIFYGDARLFNNPNALFSTSAMPNAKWEWAMIKKPESPSRLITLIETMSWVISVLLASALLLLLKERKMLTSKATQDSLTGLANRQLLNIKIEQALTFSRKYQKLMALMFIDLDYFKQINDTYGHEVGDEILKIVSEKLLNNIRDEDTLSRIGGDEFVIVLKELHQIDDVTVIAEKITSAFSDAVSVMDHNINLKLSIGIAISSPFSKETVRSLMKKADIALYEAKGAGRNGYKIFTDNK
jgi:diguanylate cyclase